MIEEACAYFPIKRTRRLLQEYSSIERVTFKAGLVMASALSNIAGELCLAAGDCSKKNLLDWQDRRIIKVKHIRKAVKETPKLANLMGTLSLRDRTPKPHLVAVCDQVSTARQPLTGESAAVANRIIIISNPDTLCMFAQQGLDLQLVQGTAHEAPCLFGEIVLRNPTDSHIVLQVRTTQALSYTSKGKGQRKWGTINPGSELRMGIEVLSVDNKEKDTTDLDDLIALIDGASAHKFVIQSGTMEHTGEPGCYAVDDLRQQEFRYSTQTAARLNRIAGKLHHC
jgi:Histone-like transcription factor (CBF/NF-Y) and archaeal histone